MNHSQSHNVVNLCRSSPKTLRFFAFLKNFETFKAGGRWLHSFFYVRNVSSNKDDIGIGLTLTVDMFNCGRTHYIFASSSFFRGIQKH